MNQLAPPLRGLSVPAAASWKKETKDFRQLSALTACRLAVVTQKNGRLEGPEGQCKSQNFNHVSTIAAGDRRWPHTRGIQHQWPRPFGSFFCVIFVTKLTWNEFDERVTEVEKNPRASQSW